MRKGKKNVRRLEKGQVLVLVALSAIIIIAIMGLTLDVGIMFIQSARMKRAVDAAALASALQYREGYTMEGLTRAANEFLRLNGIDPVTAIVDTCSTDNSLCTHPMRKLVRVRAHGTVHLAFLSVIGIDSVPINAEATSETASVDVVLVIDRSESMTWDAPAGDPMRDPSQCNNVDTGDGIPGECHPFEEVKVAARDFVRQLYFPYDQVAVVTFDKQAQVDLHLSDNETNILNSINNLGVYEAQGVCPHGDPCRRYDEVGNFGLFGCGSWGMLGDDPGQCTTTNIAEGLMVAGNEFARPPIREEALWVVILLTDGAANGGACPSSTWTQQPFCRDLSATTRHVIGDPDYDADDYAHDMADFVGRDQNALVFSIGLGPQVQSASFGDPDAGEQLLEYTVAEGVGNGAYFFAPSGAQLRDIFQRIANNIATRLSK